MDYQAGRFTDALRGYNAVLRLRPDDVNALYRLGMTEIQLGHVDNGFANVGRAIALDPSRVEFQIGLANAYGRLGRLDESVKASGRAVLLAPENAEAFTNLVKSAFESVMRGEPSSPAAVAAPGKDIKSISVVVCSRNEKQGRRIKAHYEALLVDCDFEIIQIYDARSLCEGYNRGFARTRGDVVIFSHDDIEILSADFSSHLLHHLAVNDLIGVAGTSRLVGPSWTAAGWPRTHGCVAHGHLDGSGFDIECYGPTPKGPIEAVDGVFIAANREVCEAIQFDDATFDGFHYYDLDFSYRAFLEGFRIAVPWEIFIVHHVRPDHPHWGKFPVEWEKYAPIFLAKHRSRMSAAAGSSNGRWPGVHFGSQADAVAFHRAMVRAQNIP